MFTAIPRAQRKRIALAVVTALTFTAAACGSTSQAGSSNNSATSTSTIPDTDPAVVKRIATRVLNPSVDVGALAPEVQQVLMAGSVPFTPEQRKVFKDCLARTQCETGQGKYTLALQSDLIHPYWSQARAEITAFAIKSGEVSKIVYMDSGPDLQRHLTNWRTAIGQRVDLIVPWLATVGNQVGPLVQQATAAGIPVVNGVNLPAASVADKLSAKIQLDLCGMWESAAPMLKKQIEAKGNQLTYAMFTGVPGNSYAPTWQPCAEKALDAAGFTKVYDGTTDWSPQGTVQAAAALRASGEKPGLIAYDGTATDIINVYTAAGDKSIPTIMLSGSSSLGTLQAVERARKDGYDPDVFVLPGHAWINTVALAVELEIKDGKKASSDLITVPIGITSADDVIKQVDLSLPDVALNGVLLAPEDQIEALKH